MKPSELLHGTLDILILKAVADEPRHGYAIVRQIEAGTSSAVIVEDGSLYPALYRLEKKRRSCTTISRWFSTTCGLCAT